MKKVMDDHKFHTSLRSLRRECHTEWPVRVRRTWGVRKDSHAVIDLVGYDDWIPSYPNRPLPYFSIRIYPHPDVQFQIMYLVHEWAHAMVWGAPGDDHSARWGVAYARAYRAVYGKERSE